MSIEIPKEPSIRTKTYDNFKGVDYTNDATNVWYRRSPSGVNMLPNASGRPFKRKGWKVVVTKEELGEILGTNEAPIIRCFYFELAGIDHIIIFAHGGVFKYAEDTLSFLTGSDDVDCYESSDRSFFFEGDGESAFYIYGNYKMWKYHYNNGTFTFEKLGTYDKYSSSKNGTYIPTVLIGNSPKGKDGTTLEGYNLLSSLCAEEFEHNDYNGDGSVYKVYLANDVVSGDYSKVRAYGSVSKQFDTQLTRTTGTPTKNQFKVEADTDGTYITFGKKWAPLVDGDVEDSIRIIHPYATMISNSFSSDGINCIVDVAGRKDAAERS